LIARSASLSDAELRAAQKKGSTAASGSKQPPPQQRQQQPSPPDAIPVGNEEIVRNLHERTWASLDLGVVQERCVASSSSVVYLCFLSRRPIDEEAAFPFNHPDEVD
jgi:hypothetical protein